MFERDNVFRMKNVEGTTDPHVPKIDLCVEFFQTTGAPALHFWVEEHRRERWNSDRMVWNEARTDVKATIYVYGRDLMAERPNDALMWSAWWPAEALAKGAVSGEAAGNLAWQVVHTWVVKGSEELTQELQKAAPAWWKRITTD